MAAYRAALRNARKNACRWIGPRRKTIWALCFRALGEREARHCARWRRRWRPTARRCRNARKSACRWIGPRTQNNLGNALPRLGEREAGTARLEEAVAAYRAALQEHTQERVPLDGP